MVSSVFSARSVRLGLCAPRQIRPERTLRESLIPPKAAINLVNCFGWEKICLAICREFFAISWIKNPGKLLNRNSREGFVIVTTISGKSMVREGSSVSIMISSCPCNFNANQAFRLLESFTDVCCTLSLHLEVTTLSNASPISFSHGLSMSWLSFSNSFAKSMSFCNSRMTGQFRILNPPFWLHSNSTEG